ncbi:methyl-CpG-binding domain-containing protein 13 [Arachis duranensis]|uniref:Methyl-CpG-binding domain-containing protein 13 n=1 Tax=Arachis duranensis TaxID=130453 RepID=A0A9C6WVN0_ARADU|nr:methyl-CpG-binding domain-containing protein 13 [Arachis duranensis]
MGETQLEESEATNRQISSKTKSGSKLIVEKTFEHPEWLPDGWNVDFKTRKSGSAMGQGYKCYINPHGKKFYSKLEVLRYLETIKGNNCNSRKEESNTIHSPNNDALEKPMVETSRTENSMAGKPKAGKPRGEKSTTGKPRSQKSTAEKSTVEKPRVEKSTTEKSTAEDLPPGWIIEVKERKNSKINRKDLLYIDPESGYVFRSKKDALRYLESGDISSCAIKPFKREIQDEDKLSPASTVKKQKIKQSGINRQLFAGKEISDESSLELPDANSSEKRQHVEVSSGMMAPFVPTGESIGQIQSLKNGVAYPPKTKKMSDPDDVQNKNDVVNVVENASKKNHSNPTVSKNRGFSVAHRSSPRLAAAEPDQLTNSLTSEQCLEVPRRNLRRGSQGLAADDHSLKESKLLASEIAKSGEICSDLNKSSNKKEPSVPRRASKRLAGSEPELMSNSLSYERAPEYNKSKKSKSGINTNLLSRDGEAGLKLVEHGSMNGLSSTRGRKHPQTLPVTKDKLDKRKNEEMNDEKSELEQSLAFHYSWSDPSLEFAIKTLTGTLPAEDSVANRPIVISETDKLPENDVFKNDTGSNSDKKPKVNSSKSKKKKEPKVPTRLSKRLSGHDPEVLPTETAPEYSTRKSGKNKPDANEILTNGASGKLHAGEESSNLIVHASDMLKTSKCGESSNGDELQKSQTVPNEQQRGPEAESINERSEPQFPVQFGDNWSDPCVEFAVKTLTGSVTVDAANVPVVTLDVNDPPNEELSENAVQKSSDAAADNNNHCQIKEVLNAPVCRPSEQCLEQGQPELGSNPTSYQSDPAFASSVSCGDEGKITRNSDGGQSLHVEAGNMTQIDINTLFFDDPFTEDEQILEDNSIAEQAQPGTEATNRDNSEREFCVSFMDTWSDPCLEFAFKTLTGDIQVEENMAGQGCFPEHANRHDQRNGGSALPEISMSPSFLSRSHIAEKSVLPQPPSLSHSFLSQNHMAEKSMPPQPPSLSHSFLSQSHMAEKSVPPQPPSMSPSFLSRSHMAEKSVPPQPPSMSPSFLSGSHMAEKSMPPQPPSMSPSFLSGSHMAEKSVPTQPPSLSPSFLSRSHIAEKSVPTQPPSMSPSFLSLSHMAEKSVPAQLPSMSQPFLSLSHIADKPMPAQPPSMSPSFFPPTQQSSQQSSMNSSIFPEEKSSQQHTGTDAQRHYSQYNINFQRR